MKSFRNLEGYLMKKDTKLLYFKFRRGTLEKIEVYEQPPLLEFKMLSPSEAIHLTLDDRVTPETRIGLSKDLERVGIPYYDVQLILEYTHGFNILDDYWIKFPGETLDWATLCKQKDCLWKI